MSIRTTFSGELDIVKRIEALGGVIRVHVPCCCDCDEEFEVNWWGHIPINNLDMTAKNALSLAKTVSDFVGTMCYPYIRDDDIVLRFSFYTIVDEEYPSEQFDLFTHYR